MKLNSRGYPIRPGAQPCEHYLKFRECGYKLACRWDHPEELPEIKLAGHNSKGLPLRPGAAFCMTFIRTGACPWGPTCRCDHPEPEPAPNPAATASKRMAAQQAALEIAKGLQQQGEAARLQAEKGLQQRGGAARPQTEEAPPKDDKKRRRGWDDEEMQSAKAALRASSAKLEEMVKSWIPTEKQLDAMDVEQLQTVLKSWRSPTTFTTKDALLAKAKKVILGM